MAAMYSADDYSRVLRALLPRGRVWNRDSGGVQASVLAGLAASCEALDSDAQALLIDAFPATSVFLLPEWESALGLPDPCAGPAPTVQGRQTQVLARLIGVGGQSILYFQSFAQALGYEIQVQEHTPFRIGQHGMGSPLGGIDWAHNWTVVSVLQPGGNAVLECELETVKPAHTTVTFLYPLIDLSGSVFILDVSQLA